jgi:hypothetical protein
MMQDNKNATYGEIMLRLATPRFERSSKINHFDVSCGGVRPMGDDSSGRVSR